MRVAVVGAGVSGLVVAHHASTVHDVTVYDADDHAGGHAHTVRVVVGDREYDVDTGFVVYEPETYPGFTRLLAALRVETQPAEMSFSVRSDAADLEYGGRSLPALLAQPANVVRPAFHRLLRDVLRFNRAADTGDTVTTIDAYLAAGGYSREFRDHYLVPMAAAIWSARPAQVLAMPVGRVRAFFRRHGLLRVSGQPQWRTIVGGSSRYVDAITAPLGERLRLASRVDAVRRRDDGVELRVAGHVERFDHVVVAVHAVEALRLLADATPDERRILSAFTQQENDAVLHTDAAVLPRARRAWSSWNVHLGPQTDRVALTYDMSRLQRLPSPVPLCVTLNAVDAVDPARILRRLAYRHPVYDRHAVAAQAERERIDGVGRTSFCGAYWGYGFHEDGVASALDVCRRLGVIA